MASSRRTKIASSSRKRALSAATQRPKRGGHARRSEVSDRKTLWLFDFDNTIARLEPCVDWPRARTVLEPMLRRAGAPAELFERIPRGNLPLYDAYRAHLAANGPIDATARRILTRASKIIETFELAGVDHAKPLPGALELIRALAERGVATGIVTSNSSRTVKRWLVRHSVAKSIGRVVGRDSLLALKPAPAMVIRAIEDAGATMESTSFVGDSEADLGAARASGVTFYGVASTDAARDKLLAAGASEIYSSTAALAIHLNLYAPSPFADPHDATGTRDASRD